MYTRVCVQLWMRVCASQGLVWSSSAAVRAASRWLHPARALCCWRLVPQRSRGRLPPQHRGSWAQLWTASPRCVLWCPIRSCPHLGLSSQTASLTHPPPACSWPPPHGGLIRVLQVQKPQGVAWGALTTPTGHTHRGGCTSLGGMAASPPARPGDPVEQARPAQAAEPGQGFQRPGSSGQGGEGCGAQGRWPSGGDSLRGRVQALTLSASSGTRCCTRSSTYMLGCGGTLRRAGWCVASSLRRRGHKGPFQARRVLGDTCRDSAVPRVWTPARTATHVLGVRPHCPCQVGGQSPSRSQHVHAQGSGRPLHPPLSPGRAGSQTEPSETTRQPRPPKIPGWGGPQPACQLACGRGQHTLLSGPRPQLPRVGPHGTPGPREGSLVPGP